MPHAAAFATPLDADIAIDAASAILSCRQL